MVVFTDDNYILFLFFSHLYHLYYAVPKPNRTFGVGACFDKVKFKFRFSFKFTNDMFPSFLPFFHINGVYGDISPFFPFFYGNKQSRSCASPKHSNSSAFQNVSYILFRDWHTYLYAYINL